MIASRVSLVSTSLLLGMAMLAPLAGAQAPGQPVLGLVQGTNALVRFTTATPGHRQHPAAGDRPRRRATP